MLCKPEQTQMIIIVFNARNRTLEVPVCFLKAKQAYTARKKTEKKINEYSVFALPMNACPVKFESTSSSAKCSHNNYSIK
jgi:hypothetical protein